MRYEAVLVSTTSDTLGPDLGAAIRTLRDAGVHVGIIGPVDRAAIHAVATANSTGATLVCTDPHGVEVMTVDESGAVHHNGVDPTMLTALARTGRTLVDRLAELEIRARAQPIRTGAIVVTIEDIGGEAVPFSANDIVDLARDVAFDAGIADVRVLPDGVHGVVLALGEHEDARRAVLDGLWRYGIRAGAILAVDAANTPDVAFNDIAAQVAERRAGALPEPAFEATWGLERAEFHGERDAVTSSWFALADGRIGISGAPLGETPAADRWVLAQGVYTGEGPETHLLSGPATWHVGIPLPDDAALRRVLDLRTGVVHEYFTSPSGEYRSTRFCSLARPGTCALRIAASPTSHGGSPLRAPGVNDATLDGGTSSGVAWARVVGTAGGIVAAAVEHHTPAAADGTPVTDRVATYAFDSADAPDPSPAVDGAIRGGTAGFDALLNEHRRAWSTRWEDADVVIEGDDDLQTATRFALFHLMASVADRGEVAVGARGLTGPSYRGHVFWDADTFVLPFLAATHPASARAMLEYRLRRLPRAIQAAREMGLAGARFPWESAASGAEVTPPSARDRTGRVVPIRTRYLEDHIVAQVAWAASVYVDWTGDAEFARGPGLQLLVETARYWASRARTEPDGTAHIYGVIGPDEYHEPVDDNAFTNVIARWNLRRALDALQREAPGHDVSAVEQRTWHDLANALVDSYDANTGIYEQFAGFFALEPLVIADVAPRRPIAADFLLGRERVQAAQVVKQADVLMLHHLVPEETAPDSLEPNLRYYEPRTAHGSSLSPAIHAALFARVRDYDRALPALRVASQIDLEDLTGSTAGGLHLATMGGLWQALAFGFAGLRAGAGSLHVDPHVPPGWRALELRVRFHGSRVRLRAEPSGFEVVADRPVALAVGGEAVRVGPAGRTFRRRGQTWEVQ